MKKSVSGICGLCNNPKELRESHIIPKFVYKWLQDSGGTYFRNPLQPNRRLQDGFKSYLFCEECEGIFSKNERWFSENIFIPYLNSGIDLFQYGTELSQFILSVLWRVLFLNVKEDKHKGDKNEKEITTVSEEWREALLTGKEPLSFKKIHLFLIPEVFGPSQPNAHVSLYFNRTTDGAILSQDKECLIYVKFARFMLFGEIISPDSAFRNSSIDFNGGYITTNQFIDNTSVTSFLIQRAEKVHTMFKDNLTLAQEETIKKYIIANKDKLIKSDLFKKMVQDKEAKIISGPFASSFNYKCDCCNNNLSEPEGYLLRTFEIVKSVKYWRALFKSENIGTDENDLQKRVHYFKSIVSSDQPWVTCKECEEKFEFDREQAAIFMKNWIASKGKYLPPKATHFKEHLSENELQELCLKIVSISI